MQKDPSESIFSRRWLLGGSAMGAAAFTGGGLVAPPASAARAASARSRGSAWPVAGDTSQIKNGVLQFNNDVEHLEALMRVERTLEEKEVAWWFWFIWFLMLPGRTPIPLMRYEGMEMSRHKRLPGNRFIVHGHNLSFPRDLNTGEYISEIVNPVTGEKVAAGVSVLTADPGYEFTPEGVRPLTSNKRRPLDEFWRIEDNLLHMHRVRTPPPEWPGQFIEQNTTSVTLSDYQNKSLLRVPSRTAGTWLQPAPAWLNFPRDANATVLGHFDGRKLESVRQFPQEYLQRVEREYPQLLAVDEQKFDSDGH